MIILRKIERWLWYLFLISFPFQTRIILFQTDWYFQEWRAGFLYFSDIILALLILLWLWQKRPSLKHEYVLAGFLMAAVVSLVNASEIRISLHALIRLGEGIVLYLYISQYALKRFTWEHSLAALVTGAMIQAGVAVAQFLNKSDVGLRYLGESALGIDMRGIASFFIPSGEKIIRAYGTFPHPNVLAVYLLVVLIALVYWMQTSRKKWLPVVYGFILFAFLLTFSRTVIVAGGMLGLWWGMWTLRRDKRLMLSIGIVTIAVAGLFFALFPQEVMSRFTLSGEEEAVQLRFYYNQEALKTGEQQLNWLGVGIGNFVSWLMTTQRNLPSSLYQPVHNLYLLIYAELGIIGLALFVWWLAQKIWPHIKSRHWIILGIMTSFLFISSFDHFFWTIQQGRFLWWMVMGFLFSKESSPRT